jgi:hypothetical protein
MNSVNDTVNQISNMYQFFNKELDAKLPDDVVFTLIPNRGSKGKYLGWFFQSRWQSGEHTYHEINITPDNLNRTVDEIAETLIHECVHLRNFIDGITDCNKQQYHNKKFKVLAESYGLVVERMKNKGYAHTSLGEKAKILVEKYKTDILQNTNPFVIHRITEPKGGGGGNKDKKMVAIDKDLAEEIVGASGTKLRLAVDQILREWIESHG